MAEVKQVHDEKLDVHTHPVFIPGKFELHHLVDACISKGVTCLGITDFSTPEKTDFRYLDFSGNRGYSMPSKFGRSYEVLDKQAGWLAVSRKQDGVENIVQIYRGQEVPTKEGHVLFFNLPIQIPVGADGGLISMGEAIKQAKDQDGIVIADHPYVKIWWGMGRRVLEEHLDDFDAVEWNGQCINLLPDKYEDAVMSMGLFRLWPFNFVRDAYQKGSNISALYFAQTHKKPLIATSDMHMSRLFGIGGNASQIGLGNISFENPNGKGKRIESFDLRDILNSERYKNHTTFNTRAEFLKWAVPNRLNAVLERFNLLHGDN